MSLRSFVVLAMAVPAWGQTAPEPARAPAPEPAKAPAEARPDLNLLGRTNTQRGESRRNENIQFNLIDNNALKELNIRLGTTATIVNEFQPQRQYFGVEYGNNPPALIHVSAVKPTAGRHGTFYWTHNNSVFSARSFFQVGSVKPSRENQGGGSFTSSPWKDAYLTLDGSHQLIRGNVNGNVLVPRLNERTPLATDPEIRREIARYLAGYPAAEPNRTDIDARALNTNSLQAIDTTNASARIDQILGKRDRITLRHALTSQQIDAFQLVAGQNPDTATRSHMSRITWQRTWTARTLLDVSTGFDRVRSQLMPEPNAVGPQVSIGTAFTSLGPGSNVPLDRVQNRFRKAAMVSHQRGAHKLVFGGELTRLRFNGREASSNRGNVYFRNDFARDAITNFRMGVPSRYSTGLGEIDRGFRNWEQHLFVGDAWQALPSLSLNLGVRYQPNRGPYEVNRQTAVPFDCDCNNFAPRFGFAYRLPRLAGVVRGAYGLHYSDLPAVTLQQLRWNPPEFQKIEAQAPPLINPLRDAVISRDGRATLFSVPRNTKAPYSHQYNFSIEVSPRANWRLQLGYAGSRTYKLLMMWHLNRARVVPGIGQTTATINDRRPDARYFDVRQIENAARAYFDAARITLIVPESRGLSLDASYWFSKAIDTGATYLNTAAGDDARQGYGQSQEGVVSDLRGPSPFDQSHAALVRVRYSVPAPRTSHAFLRRAFGRWTASAIWLGKTGMPFSVTSASDSPGFGNVDGTNGDRPHLVDPSVLGRTIGHPDTSVQLLPRAAFRFIAPTEPRGSLGSNTFRRGRILNMNASLSRTWAFAGDRSVTFRAESVNLTNAAQFAEPNYDLTSPAFGKITNTLNDGRTFQFTVQLRF